VYGYYPQEPRPRRASESMQRLGNDVHVIAMMGNGQAREEEVEGVLVHRLPLQVIRGSRARYIFQYLVFLLGSGAMLLRLHLIQKFDIVHVHSLPDFQVFCAAPEKLLGARIVLDLHEAMPELFAARFGYRLEQIPVRIVKASEWVSCLFADSVIVVNEMMRRRLVASGFGDTKVVVVMTSPPLASARDEAAQGVVEQLEINDKRAIVYVGGVNRERDLSTLIRATSILQSKYKVALVIVGHGEEDYRSELRALAREQGIDHFIMRGRVPHNEAPTYMALSEVGPITYERNYLTDISMPTKALEYSAASKPLVIANLRGVREVYGDAALYYEPGDANDLAGKIDSLLNDTVLVQRLVDKGSAVLKECSWELMEKRLHSAYIRPAPEETAVTRIVAETRP
jgi:glycosyltransferase involved in cell wall biosynthesis